MKRPSWETNNTTVPLQYNTNTFRRPSWETSNDMPSQANAGAYSFKKPSWESNTLPTEQPIVQNEPQTISQTATKTPIDQRLHFGGDALKDDNRSYIGMNIIPAYKEDSTLKKVGKGIVNYGLGGALSLIGNIFNAPQQAMMQADRAIVNVTTGKPQDFSEMSFGKDILGAKEENFGTMLLGTALDPMTYVGGGILDDMSKAGLYGKGKLPGTTEYFDVYARMGDDFAKQAAKEAKKAGSAVTPAPQQATPEYLRAEKIAAKRDAYEKGTNLGTGKPLYVAEDGSVIDKLIDQQHMLPAGVDEPTGQAMINMTRKALNLPDYKGAQGKIEIPNRVTPDDLAKIAAKKEAVQPKFTAYTSTGPSIADTRSFTDDTGKTLAQFLQGDEVYDDIVKNLEGANYISDESIKAIAQGIKDKSGLTLNFKDVYRNFRDAFGRAYPYVKEKYLDPFDAAKKAYVETIKKYTDDIYENVVKRLGIKKGTKESAAVQWFGEGQRMVGVKIEIDPQTGRKISMPNMVAYKLDDLQKEFPKTWQQIVEADGIFRQAYDELIDAVNATRRQIYPTNPEKLVPKRTDYYRHFREMQDTFEGFKNMFETPSGIDPKLAGISEFTKPKSRWASFMQKRGMGAYKADAVGGFIDYIQPASYAIHIDPHIVKFRALAKDIAEGTSKTRNANNFIKWLNDFANNLAGKTSKYDRLLQEDIPGGRTTMRLLNWLNNRVKANQILMNARSSVSQLANVPAGIGRIHDPVALGKGMGDTLAGIIGKGKSPKLYKASQFLSERYYQDLITRFDHKLINQPKKFAAWLMGVFDELGTKFIWNSSYNKAVADGITDPLKYADDLTRSVVAGRGIGEVPLIQQSKLFQLAAPFQLEVANLWHVIGDMVKEKDFAGIITLFIGNYLFNNVIEDLTGNRVTFDPIDAITDALSEEDMNAWKATGRLGGEVLSNIPLGQTIATLYPEYGFNMSGIEMPTRQELFGDNDPTRFGSGLLVVKGLQDPLSKVLPPFGGAQAKKTYEAITALTKGGEFNDDKLKYLVDTTPENIIKGTLFGKSAFDEAKEYYDKDRRELSEKQTQQVMNATDKKALYEDIMRRRRIETLKTKIKAIKNSKITPTEKEKKIKELQKQLEAAADDR